MPRVEEYWRRRRRAQCVECDTGSGAFARCAPCRERRAARRRRLLPRVSPEHRRPAPSPARREMPGGLRRLRESSARGRWVKLPRPPWWRWDWEGGRPRPEIALVSPLAPPVAPEARPPAPTSPRRSGAREGRTASRWRAGERSRESHSPECRPRHPGREVHRLPVGPAPRGEAPVFRLRSEGRGGGEGSLPLPDRRRALPPVRAVGHLRRRGPILLRLPVGDEGTPEGPARAGFVRPMLPPHRRPSPPHPVQPVPAARPNPLPAAGRRGNLPRLRRTARPAGGVLLGLPAGSAGDENGRGASGKTPPPAGSATTAPAPKGDAPSAPGPVIGRVRSAPGAWRRGGRPIPGGRGRSPPDGRRERANREPLGGQRTSRRRRQAVRREGDPRGEVCRLPEAQRPEREAPVLPMRLERHGLEPGAAAGPDRRRALPPVRAGQHGRRRGSDLRPLPAADLRAEPRPAAARALPLRRSPRRGQGPVLQVPETEPGSLPRPGRCRSLPMRAGPRPGRCSLLPVSRRAPGRHRRPNRGRMLPPMRKAPGPVERADLLGLPASR